MRASRSGKSTDKRERVNVSSSVSVREREFPVTSYQLPDWKLETGHW
jgi:hypothetical protein